MLAVWLAGFSAWSGIAAAHGGLTIDQDRCKLRVGPYEMHFAGYQPESNAAREFCEDIPSAGYTVMVLDAVDQALRGLPLEVRIVSAAGDESELQRPALLHLPPKIYPAGSLSLEYRFSAPGNFVGVVRAGANGEYQARFPFAVGAGERLNLLSLWAGLGGVLAAFGLFFYSEYRAKKRVARKG